MSKKKYRELMNVLNNAFDNPKSLVIQWDNELIVKCTSITGEYETDTEPGDENYVGEYAAVVEMEEMIQKGKDESVRIYNRCIEISLKCIPKKISMEDGTILWENNNDRSKND